MCSDAGRPARMSEPSVTYLVGVVLVRAAVTWTLRAAPLPLLAPLRRSRLLPYPNASMPVGVMTILVIYSTVIRFDVPGGASMGCLGHRHGRHCGRPSVAPQNKGVGCHIGPAESGAETVADVGLSDASTAQPLQPHDRPALPVPTEPQAVRRTHRVPHRTRSRGLTLWHREVSAFCPRPVAITRSRLPFDAQPSRPERRHLLRPDVVSPSLGLSRVVPRRAGACR